MFQQHLWNENFAYIPCISLRTRLCWLSRAGNSVICILFLDFVRSAIVAKKATKGCRLLKNCDVSVSWLVKSCFAYSWLLSLNWVLVCHFEMFAVGVRCISLSSFYTRSKFLLWRRNGVDVTFGEEKSVDTHFRLPMVRGIHCNPKYRF